MDGASHSRGRAFHAPTLSEKVPRGVIEAQRRVKRRQEQERLKAAYSTGRGRQRSRGRPGTVTTGFGGAAGSKAPRFAYSPRGVAETMHNPELRGSGTAGAAQLMHKNNVLRQENARLRKFVNENFDVEPGGWLRPKAVAGWHE